MHQKQSELIFATLLNKYNIHYERDCIVNLANRRNVDFCISFRRQNIFCDVKEVLPTKGPDKGIVAHKQIQKDIKKLRSKFGSTIPTLPVVLVTVNYSARFFTGLTVKNAMFGELSMTFRKKDFKQIGPTVHSRSKASLAAEKNRTISGILVLNYGAQNVYFANPFARHKIKRGIFPETMYLTPQPVDEIKKFSNIVFGAFDAAG
jgi:hypothetical protein